MKILLTLFVLLACDAHAQEIRWDDLIASIIEVESGGRPDAVSPAGAIGLMQITPIVVKEFNKNYIDTKHKFQTVPGSRGYYPMPVCPIDLYRGSCNKAIGTWYLRRLKDHYLKDNYTVERLLAAYNGGITRLRKCNYDVSKMPKESRDYVKKVMRLYKEVK